MVKKKRKKRKASNNFKCVIICHRCVNPVAAQEHRDDVWIHLDLLIKNALISLLCAACSVHRLLEQARPPHHTAHSKINRPTDAARKTSRLRCSCDHTKKALGPQNSSNVSNQFCHKCFDNYTLHTAAETKVMHLELISVNVLCCTAGMCPGMKLYTTN